MVEKLRIYQIAILCCIAIIIVLLSLAIHFGIKKDSKPQEEKSVDETSQAYIASKYKWFFRTAKEQVIYFERAKSLHMQVTPVKPCKDTQRINEAGMELNETEGAAYHGCCKSKMIYISPDTALNTQGKNVTLVQFADDRQYFNSEECCQVENCQTCTCMQGSYDVNALVMNTDSGANQPAFLIQRIQLPGCCKCYNTN